MFKLIKRLFHKKRNDDEIEALRELVDSYRKYIDSLKNMQELHKQNSSLKIDLLLKKLEELTTQRNPYPGVF